jgi:hypothetical protein
MAVRRWRTERGALTHFDHVRQAHASGPASNPEPASFLGDFEGVVEVGTLSPYAELLGHSLAIHFATGTVLSKLLHRRHYLLN